MQLLQSQNIIMEYGLLARAGEELRKLHAPCRAAVISDSNAGPLYGGPLADSLRKAGFQPFRFDIPAGEEHKNLTTYASVLDFMAQSGLSRGDIVIALGGGVTGDLAGFAAATYQRGIPVVQMPSSLLAMTDSAMGGKTGVDLPSGKNQVGAFHMPLAVLTDPALLSTLPANQLRAGMGEVIKYGMIGAPELLELPAEISPQQTQQLIRRCAEIKCSLTAQDPEDRGVRQTLNFGHTFGHAIEFLSGYSLLHGEAVAAGMGMITRAAVKLGYADASVLKTLQEALQRRGLPDKADYPPEAILAAAAADKKRSGAMQTLVMPREVGRTELISVSRERFSEIVYAAAGDEI